MTSTQRTESGPGASGPDGGRQPAATGPAFRIRYGRLTLALAGLLSLLTGVVSAVLRIFGLGPRLAAVRRVARRRGRRRHAPPARGPGPPPENERRVSGGHERTGTPGPVRAGARAAVWTRQGEPRERAESPLFDAQADAAERSPGSPNAADRPGTAPGGPGGSRGLGGHVRPRRRGCPAAEGSSWEPVEVPKPTYVEAPKAERAAPEPLDLPEAPKAVGKPSLKQGLPQAPAGSLGPDSRDRSPLGKAQSALSNLDDVLQRRRA